MKARLTLCIFALVLPLLAEDWDEKGRLAFTNGRYREAKSAFEKAVIELTGNPREQAVSLANLGQTQLALGEIQDAIATLQLALIQRQDAPEIWRLLGQAQIEAGARAAALESLNRALRLATNQQKDRLAAICLADLAQWSASAAQQRKWLESALEQANTGAARWRILANLAALDQQSGNFPRAGDLLRQAIAELEAEAGANHPDLAYLLEQYAGLLRRTRQKQAARAASERARILRSDTSWQSNSNQDTVNWKDLQRKP